MAPEESITARKLILDNQEKLDALFTNQEIMQANQAKILVNQSAIISLPDSMISDQCCYSKGAQINKPLTGG